MSYAAQEGQEAVAELLLTRGAAVDSKNNIGQTPLTFAARFGHKAVVELPLNRGAAVESMNSNEQTPLS